MAARAARRDVQRTRLLSALASVYTPGSPIDDPALFSGRTELLADLRAELSVAGVHLVLYGERGVGKTSLWHVLLHERRVQHHSASSSDDFVSIFLRVLEALGEQFTAEERKRLAEVSSSLGKDGVARLGSKLGEETTEKPIEARRLDLNFVLDRVARRARSLDAIVIDEFQNISRHAVQTQIIEVVKGFADRALQTKILLVGVGDTDDELIPAQQYAQYKGRHFIARRIPRMSDSEVQDILTLREQKYSVHFEDDVKDVIVRIASGYPATVHRLALTAAQSWVRRAFAGYTTRSLTSLGMIILHVFPLAGAITAVIGGAGARLIQKAGISVELQDLHRAVTRFVEGFREHHPDVVSRCDELLTSSRGDTVMEVLRVLSASPMIKMAVSDLAREVNMSRPDLDSLLREDARGLVEVTGAVCRLTVRDVMTFVKARSFAAERRAVGTVA